MVGFRGVLGSRSDNAVCWSDLSAPAASSCRASSSAALPPTRPPSASCGGCVWHLEGSCEGQSSEKKTETTSSVVQAIGVFARSRVCCRGSSGSSNLVLEHVTQLLCRVQAPIGTIPLVFSFVIAFSVVINDPNGVLATWLSIIPLSSPIVMVVRAPFEPPLWQVITSMLVLLATIIGIIWLAGKIYRTGILMYGKKPTYKELAKWLFYKN